MSNRTLVFHGLSRTPEYAAWASMRHRCQVPSAAAYPRYGGRGIGVCEAWSSVAQFVKDMGPRPSPLHTLEREDNDGDYSPGNCRWATVAEQNKNRSVSRFVEHQGVTRTVQEWSTLTGIKYTTILRRIDNWGWGVEKALTQTPTITKAQRARNERGQYA